MNAINCIPRPAELARDGSKLIRHATERMIHRGIQTQLIEQMIEYGRVVYTRGAVVYGSCAFCAQRKAA